MNKWIQGLRLHPGSFQQDRCGSTSVQTALWFGAIAMAVSVLAAPKLHDAVDLYAENRAFGIDRVMTGSVKQTKQYTVRKSVLDK